MSLLADLPFATTQQIVILIIITLGFFIVLVREYFRVLLRRRELASPDYWKLERQRLELERIKLKEERDAQGLESSRLSEPHNATATVVDFNFKLLEKYYEQHLIEYKVMSRATLLIAILGFVVILIGVFMAISGQTSVGIISGLAGVIAEGASALFFKQNQVLINQVQEYHKKLVSTQYPLTGISLVDNLPAREAAIQRERIIGNLLFLSNELHGSNSAHLWSGYEQRESLKAELLTHPTTAHPLLEDNAAPPANKSYHGESA